MANDNKGLEFEDGEQEEIEGQSTGEGAGEKAGEETSGGMLANLTYSSFLPYVGVLGSGVVLLIALTIGGKYIENHKYYEYGIAVAVVSMFFALTGWGLAHTDLCEGKFGRYNNLFLVVWGFIGACALTFGGPFEITGNGYFGAWGIVIFSTLGLGVSADDVKGAVGGMGAMFGFLVSSLIVIIAIASEGFDHYKGELIYAIIVACITVLVLGGLIMMQHGNGGEPHMLALLIHTLFAILWIILACLVTFRGPFQITGNGYFGAWGGAITGVFAAFAAKGGKGDEAPSGRQEV